MEDSLRSGQPFGGKQTPNEIPPGRLFPVAAEPFW